MAELRLAPGLAFALAAVMIEPRWTVGSRFTLAYELPSDGSRGPYMVVRDGLPVTVSGEADPAAVEYDDRLRARPSDGGALRGAARRDDNPRRRASARAAQAWVERAQSD